MLLYRPAAVLAAATSSFQRTSSRHIRRACPPQRILTTRAMAVEKAVPGSIEPYASTYSRRKGNKSTEPADCEAYSVPDAEAATKEGDGAVSEEMESLRKESGRLNTMTLKELRALTRYAGISVKGSKKDLLSAVESYLAAPQSSQQHKSKMTSSKRKTKTSLCEETLSIAGTSGTRRKKAKSRTNQADSSHQAETILDKKKSSINREVLEKNSNIQRKVILKIATVSTESVPTEPWTVLTHKKPQPGWVPYDPKVLRPPPLGGNSKSMKLMSWNVNGLRALLKSKNLSMLELAQRENFDVLCLQETKMQEKDVEAIRNNLIDGYDNSYWTCSISKLGYSGTAIISRIKPISVKYGLDILDHDSEGRLVTVEFDSVYLLCVYVPNSGDGLKRLSYRINEWDISLSNYMKELEKSKPVIMTGDLNCAHEEIDIYDPAGNRRSAGFTIEERESFEKNFLSRGFVDTFRRQHPLVVGYSYYGYRHGGRKTNKGWRLDYYLVSESIADKVHDSYILPDVTGSDHCPIGLILNL